MLVLEVEFWTGRYSGAATQFDERPDFPPQPDRMYCALVAAWGARDRRSSEEMALRYLERLPAPTIRASAHTEQSSPKVFVPVNDLVMGIQSHPQFRMRQERRFPVASPHDSILTYSWTTADCDTPLFECLQALAQGVSHLGRATSFVRCCFHREFPELEHRPIVPTRRSAYPGYFDKLAHAFKHDRKPPQGMSLPPPEAPRRAPTRSIFGSNWVVYSDAGGRRPDLRHTATAARALRTAILSAFDGREAPQVLSGHRGDTGRPVQLPHMAIFPLANVGWKNSDERIMGLAVCLPRELSDDDKHAFVEALLRLHRRSRVADRGGMEIEVDLSRAERWLLARLPEPVQSSLKPQRYVRAATTWNTVTPIVLEGNIGSEYGHARHEEVIHQLKLACLDIGLPKPRQVVADSNSAVNGTPSVVASQRPFRTSRKRPRWSRHQERRRAAPTWEQWSLPKYLARRPLTHATLVWDRPIEGPVALGAGRFMGLGLCLPKD